MKLTNIATTFLAVSVPFAVAESGGLKGAAAADRKLQTGAPGAWCARNGCGTARQTTLPTIDELNDIYGTFCDICAIADQITQALGEDGQFCTTLCDLIDEIPDPDSITCFSEISTVQVENHVGSVAMKDLQVGARVLTQPGTYEPVYAFGHKNPTKAAEFLQFQTADATLEMTGGHLVFLEGKMNPVRADSVKVGDTLSGGKITKISTIQRDGVYSPLTPSGKIVVDGIVASTYISLQKESNEYVEFQGGMSSYLSFQDFIHMTLSPFRMLCMGVSSSLGNTYTADGIPLYAAYGMDFAKWADQQNIVVQFFLFLAVGALAGASMFVENTFGAAFGPTALVAGAAAYAMMKKNGIRFGTGSSKIKSV